MYEAFAYPTFFSCFLRCKRGPDLLHGVSRLWSLEDSMRVSGWHLLPR